MSRLFWKDPFLVDTFEQLRRLREKAKEQFALLLRSAELKRAIEDGDWTVDWRKIDSRHAGLTLKVDYLPPGSTLGGCQEDPSGQGFLIWLYLFSEDEGAAGQVTQRLFLRRLRQHEEVFVHEFIHYQDMRRAGSFGAAKGSRYFRDPREFAAFYQTGAVKLVPLMVEGLAGRGIVKDPGVYRARGGKEKSHRLDQKVARSWFYPRGWEYFQEDLDLFWEVDFLEVLDKDRPLKAAFLRFAKRDFEQAKVEAKALLKGKRRNPGFDEERRRLVRQAQAGDAVAQVKLLCYRVRAGELNPYYLRAAARLGEPVAVEAAALSGLEPLEGNDGWPWPNYASAHRGEFTSIGHQPVDLVLSRLVFQSIDHLLFGAVFIEHAATHLTLAIPLPVGQILDLARAYRQALMDRDRMVDEFYARPEIVALPFRESQPLFDQFYVVTRQRIEDLRREAQTIGRTLPSVYTEASTDLKWALCTLCRMIHDRSTPAVMDLLWIAIYCRMQAGVGSPEDQARETAWQTGYTVQWLLK